MTKEHRVGILRPFIDRTRCEGGFHNECKEQGLPCIIACPNLVLEIRALRGADKKGLSFSEKFRILVHKNRQAYVIRPAACDACGECIKVCPAHAIKLKRPGREADEKPKIFAKFPAKEA